jgi:hypothetical protein
MDSAAQRDRALHDLFHLGLDIDVQVEMQCILAFRLVANCLERARRD